MRIAVVGDICLETELDTWRRARIPHLHDAFRADVVIGNVESVVDGPATGSPQTGKIHLSAPAEALEKLRDIGVDYLSVANNHIMDFGERSARATIEQLQGIFGEDRVFGWRGSPTAQLAPGLNVLGVCFAETNPRTVEGLAGPVVASTAEGLVSAHSDEDSSLLVFAHWGEEQLSLASPVQRERARSLVADGASHVVGSHSHVIGPGEELSDRSLSDGGPTALYSLGNFLFRVMPKGNARMLGSNTRSAAAVYDWDGSTLRYVGWHECQFDTDFNLEIRDGSGAFPGSLAARAHLDTSAVVFEQVYDWALSTRGLRVGAAKVLTGVERPSLGKVRTAFRLMFGSR